MESLSEAIGHRIRYFRLSKDLTQEELAFKSELHNTYIGQIERGEKNLSILSLTKILKALELSYTDFFEPFDIEAKGSSIAAKCYDIINRQSTDIQEDFFLITKTLDDMMHS